jgi:Holliday junction resolvasome RuvABC endonuclease subunit
MKIAINKIEEVTGYKIKKNFVSLGLDTAQRTGVAFIKTTDKYVNIDCMFLEFKGMADTKQIYKTMVNTFSNIFTEQDFAVIEQVFVGFNRAGSVELARYGSFAIAECIKKGIAYDLISAVSCRAKLGINTRSFGKGKSKQAVAFWLKDKLNIELNDEDASDAICLALCGIFQDFDFKPKPKAKKKRKK